MQIWPSLFLNLARVYKTNMPSSFTPLPAKTCQVSPAQRWIRGEVGLACQWFDPLLWISKIWGFSMTPHLWGCKSCHYGSTLTANLRLFQCTCGNFPLLSPSSSWRNHPLTFHTATQIIGWGIHGWSAHTSSISLTYLFFFPFKAPWQVQILEYLLYEGRLQELLLFGLKIEKGSH